MVKNEGERSILSKGLAECNQAAFLPLIGCFYYTNFPEKVKRDNGTFISVSFLHIEELSCYNIDPLLEI